jgi:hypothetical protein
VVGCITGTGGDILGERKLVIRDDDDDNFNIVNCKH